MNLTDTILRNYIEFFHRTYIDTAEKYLPKDKLSLLLRYPLIKGRTIGYVSTQFGAGYEYVDADVQNIEVRVSSARIEDFLIGAPNRVRKLQPMFLIGGTNTTIGSLTIDGAFPVRLTSINSSVRLIDVQLKALDWTRIVEFAELYGNRTVDFWSEKNAISKAKDEILLALVDIHEAAEKAVSLEEYLSTFKQKHVLILGDFSETGRQRLNNIKQILVDLGYVPILLDEVPDDLNYNLSQKATAVGAVARFIVIDDSSKAGHLVEFPHVQSNNWTTIVLRLDGSEGTFMTKGASSYSKVIVEKTYIYSNLDQVLRDSVDWAEKTIIELKKESQDIYPWRKNEKNIP